MAWLVQRKVYFAKYYEETTYSVSNGNEELNSHQSGTSPNVQMDFTFLRVNSIETQESWVQLGQFVGYTFYDIQNVIMSSRKFRPEPSMILFPP